MSSRPPKGAQFGRFTLTERIAIGGMAEVFAAKLRGAMGFEKQLVVKRILPNFAADRNFVRMLATEARLTCNLEHPNIVQVYELGEVDGRYYIAMEFVNGIDLRQLWRALARRGLRLPVPLALFVVSEFLKGLDFAHNAIGPDGKRLGVVHRDVSPSNVLVSFRGDIKIGDFGIALVQQESKNRNSTVKGKFGYMTPEQLSGLQVDHRSDLFATGIVLAELLTGRRIFKGQNDYETMRRVLHVDLRVLDESEESLPPEVTGFLRRAISRDVGARYQSAAAFQDEIASYIYETAGRVTNRTLAAFMANHVIPHLERRKGESDDLDASENTLEPETINSMTPSGERIETTPSGDLVSDGDDDDDLPTAPGVSEDELDQIYQHQQGHVGTVDAIDWSRLQPLGAGADGVEQPTRDGGGLSGYVQRQLDGEVQDEVSEGESPAAHFVETDGGIKHYGEAEFDFSDASELELQTADEVDARIGEDMSGKFVAMADDSVPAALDALDVSLRLEEATALRKPKANFRGGLGAHTVARVLFRFMVAGEDGLLVLTGPGLAGPVVEFHDWLKGARAKYRSASDNPQPQRRTCQVHLAKGQPDLISADRSEEDLVVHMLRVGLLNQAKVSKAIRANPGLKPTAAVVASGRVAPLQLSRQLASFVQWSVLDAFSWTSGSFAFFRGRPGPVGFPTTYTGYEIIAKGASYLDEPTLDRHLTVLGERELEINPSPAEPEELFPAAPVPQISRAVLGGANTVRAILEEVNADTLRTKQAIYVLTECELLEPVG